MGRNVYDNPPIKEAMIEVGFRPAAWDPCSLGRFYDRMQGVFDGNFAHENLLQEVQTSPQEAANIPVSRYKFQNTEGTRVVQILPNAVSAHVVNGYEGWDESFRPFAMETFRGFEEGYRWEGIDRISIRVINAMRFPTEGTVLETYIRNLPPIPDIVPVSIINVVQQSNLYLRDENALLEVSFGTSPTLAEEQDINVILDLGATHRFGNESPSLDVALEKADRLHVVLRTVFESYITDEMRNRLGWKNAVTV